MKMEEGARPLQEEVLASLELAEERVKQAEERCERLLKEAMEGKRAPCCLCPRVNPIRSMQISYQFLHVSSRNRLLPCV